MTVKLQRWKVEKRLSNDARTFPPVTPSKTLRLSHARRRDGTLKSRICVTCPKWGRGRGAKSCRTRRIPLWKLAKWLEGPSGFLQDELIRSLRCWHPSASPNLCIPKLVRPQHPRSTETCCQTWDTRKVWDPPPLSSPVLVEHGFLISAKQISRFRRFESKSSPSHSVTAVQLNSFQL